MTSRLFLALAYAFALALGACGDDEEATPPSTDGGNSDDGGPDDDASVEDAGEDAGADAATAPQGTLDRYAGYQSIEYADEAHWLCRPDTEDACDDDLNATVVNADGTTELEDFVPAADPEIDCFYVYPTISNDETAYSDWEASPQEEEYVAYSQAGRLGAVCRVFAPIYRQRTLTSLLAALGGGGEGPTDEGDPFADVLDAFRTYMATENAGRGFVLIGHSQGAGLLTELISAEIDGNEDVRARMVAAYIVGSAVAVPEGELVGGSFENVPLCSEEDETGCVLTWATFRSTATPPENSYFGKPRTGDGVAGCVNPAAVEGGSAELHAYLPSDPDASILGGGGGTGSEGWLPGTPIETRLVTVPGLLTGECVTRDGFSYLEVTVHGDAEDPRRDDIGGDLSPEWGLHLIDVSIAMGDIVARVAAQAAAF
jgi:hypothetical protein